MDSNTEFTEIIGQETFFRREYKVPVQENFSPTTRHLALVPIRGELRNHGLTHFLEMMSQQATAENQNLGIVFLINDNREDKDYSRGTYGDEAISKSTIPQNKQTARFLECLSSRNSAQLEQLEIDDELKKLGRKIIKMKKVEVRFDYISLTENKPHFGKLRGHLNDLAEKYKDPSLQDTDIVAHLLDIDMGLSTHHIQRMMRYYSDPNHTANVCNYDFLPGVYEGDPAYDISREMLMTVDSYRLYQYSQNLYRVLTDGYAVGTPAISARLSYLRKPDVGQILDSRQFNEDFALTTKLRQDLKTNLGNEDEVYFTDRARHSYSHAMTDAEVRYQYTQRKRGKTPRVLLEVERLLEEAEGQKPRELSNILKLRVEWQARIRTSLVKNDTFYHDTNWWFNNMDHIKQYYGNELIAIGKALQKDLPELTELLQTADQNDELGASLLYMGVLMQMVKAENDFSLYDKEKGFDYNSEQERVEFSQRLVKHICQWDIANVRGVRLTYQIPEETEGFIGHIYDVMAKIDPDFQESKQLGLLLQLEERLETAKVRLRSIRLQKVIGMIIGEKQLGTTDQKIITLFLEKIPEIEETVKQKKKKGKTKEEIAKDIEVSYKDFFDFTSPVHEQIAQIRALRRYILERGIQLSRKD